MTEKKQNPLKLLGAVVLLAGAVAFTLGQVGGGSDSSAPRLSSTVPELQAQDGTSVVPGAPAMNDSREAPKPKALAWKDYLAFDPFAERTEPNTELYALAARPSPFYAEGVLIEVEQESVNLPGFLSNLHLNALLEREGEFIAVINHKPYKQGDLLRTESSALLADPVFGNCTVKKIDGKTVYLETGGELFPLSIKKESNLKIRFLKKPKSKDDNEN